MSMMEIISTLGNPAQTSVYLLLDTGMNAPRFLALGSVIGYRIDQQKRRLENESNDLP